MSHHDRTRRRLSRLGNLPEAARGCIERLEDRRLLTTASWFELQEVTDQQNFDRDADALTSLAISSDTLVVGNRKDDTAATDAGAVFIYSLDNADTPSNPTDDRWNLTQTLIPSDVQPGDLFGASVALEGDRLVIGADHSSECCAQLGDGLGVAYVYGRQPGGDWVLEQKLTPVDRGGINDRFGIQHAMAMEGDLIAVGAIFDDNTNGVDAGAVHLFRFDGNQWNHEAKIIAPAGNPEDRFGTTVALDGGELVVGANLADGNVADTGMVYLFAETTPGSGDWVLTATLQASDGKFNDRFTGVAKEGDTLIVTARLADDVGVDSGAAYVFERTGGTWEEITKLRPSGHDAGDQFGPGVAIVDGVVAVNAPNNDGLLPGRGATHIFEKLNGTWTEVDKVFPSSRSPTDSAGNGDWIIGMTSQQLVTVYKFDDVREVFAFARDAQHTRETQLSTDTPRSLQDASRRSDGVTNSSLQIMQDLEIVDVNVRLDIDHASTDQLDVFLVAPDGARIELFSDVGGSGDNFVATILDDDVSTSITSSTAPFTGNFVPEGDLSSLVGLNAKGNWTLEVHDDTRRTRGTLENWSLSVLGRTLAPSLPEISIGHATVQEGNTALFSVVLTEPSASTVSVDFATSAGSADEEIDYVASSGTLTFAPGETTATIAISTIEDALDEPHESFVVNLSNPSGATLAAGQYVGTGTIEDDDSPSDPNILYVYDIRFESKRGNKDWRAVFEIRKDSNFNGQADDDDSAASGASLDVNFAGQTYLDVTTGANGEYRTPWIRNLAAGDHYANALDVALVEHQWDLLLSLTQENDSDDDGKPDAILAL